MDIFEILGPVMVGPSSSHTAGAARIGSMARTLLGSTPVKAAIHLHGSFADTGLGHGTDRALVAGLLGMKPDDLRIPYAFEEAKKAGLSYTIDVVELRDAHPNTALIEVWGTEDKHLEMQASSLGGGRIMVDKLDGINVNFTGAYNTLGGDALMIIETDQHIKPEQVTFIGQLPGILSITYYDKEEDDDVSGFDEGNL